MVGLVLKTIDSPRFGVFLFWALSFAEGSRISWTPVLIYDDSLISCQLRFICQQDWVHAIFSSFYPNFFKILLLFISVFHIGHRFRVNFTGFPWFLPAYVHGGLWRAFLKTQVNQLRAENGDKRSVFCETNTWRIALYFVVTKLQACSFWLPANEQFPVQPLFSEDFGVLLSKKLRVPLSRR